MAFDEYHFGAWRETAKELFEGEDDEVAKKETKLEYAAGLEDVNEDIAVLSAKESKGDEDSRRATRMDLWMPRVLGAEAIVERSGGSAVVYGPMAPRGWPAPACRLQIEVRDEAPSDQGGRGIGRAGDSRLERLPLGVSLRLLSEGSVRGHVGKL